MTNENLIVEAQNFAHAAHDSVGQKRKYSGLPYWVHTDEVAGIVASVTNDPKIIAAAHLHDVLEDVNVEPYTVFDICSRFGGIVAGYVCELTDVYTKQNFPSLNRKQRKIAEAERLSKVSAEAQTVKLADLISNSRDIVRNDPGFAITYLKEKEQILNGLTRGNHELFKLATELLNLGKKALNIR